METMKIIWRSSITRQSRILLSHQYNWKTTRRERGIAARRTNKKRQQRKYSRILTNKLQTRPSSSLHIVTRQLYH